MFTVVVAASYEARPERLEEGIEVRSFEVVLGWAVY